MNTSAYSRISSLAIRLTSTVLQGVSGARLTVLIFHRVLSSPDPLFSDIPDAARFAQQLAILRDCFRIMPLEEAIAGLASCRLPRRAAAITFDDGYSDNATVAAPLLRRFGMSGTFFVATGFIDGGRMWNDSIIESIRRCQKSVLDLSDLGLGTYGIGSNPDRLIAIRALLARIKYLPLDSRQALVERIVHRTQSTLPGDLMMKSDQILAMARQGMAIGAHTVNHPILASIGNEEAEREIRDSKASLEALLGKPVTLFAYPNGKPGVDYEQKHVQMVKQVGFTAAVSTSAGVATRGLDLFQIPRFTPYSLHPGMFELQLSRNLLRTRYPVAKQRASIRL